MVCPGLGGGSHNLYCTAIIWLARAKGFKCATLCFRGANDLPITSGKLSYSGCWQDIESCLNYIAKQYNTVQDERSGKRRTRVYAFGASLGAQILALYLGKAGKQATEVLDGAVLYANAWSIRKGSQFFYENFFGLYQWAIGMNFNSDVKNNQLPKMRPYLSAEDYAHYENALKTNRTGLNHLDEHVYLKMFGYKNVTQYYESVSCDTFLKNVAVPTFGFGAIDDQLFGYQFTPFEQIASDGSQVLLASSSVGAHASHMTGNLIPQSWHQIPCMEFLSFIETKLAKDKKKID